MKVIGFRARFLIALAAAAALARATPVAGAVKKDPPVFLAQIIVSEGPGSSFLQRFEGLGDVAAAHLGDFRGGFDVPRGQVRLFRGFTLARDWWDWRQQVLDSHGRQGRHDVSIVLFDQTLAEVARWELKGAWPLNLKVSLDADGEATEELVLAHGPISLVNPPPSSTP